MRKTLHTHWFFILILLGLSVYYLVGVGKIPFHPDESTLIFMGADIERLFSDPGSLVWNFGDPVPDVVRYRMIDAPLTRYFLGLGRVLLRIPALESDWDWSASWEENTLAGALPDSQLLLIERSVIAFFFPLTIILLYWIGIKLDGRFLGVLIVLIFGLNPLILLHTRRAMAEGILVFGLVLTLYALIKFKKYPILVGLTVAVAFNAKHSALVLFPIGLLIVSWTAMSANRSMSRLISNASQYLLIFVLITLFLNPVLWRNPIAAAHEALEQRQSLLVRQQADFKQRFPTQILETPAERLIVMIAHTIITPPIFAEVGNYREETSQAEFEYLKITGTEIGRNYVVGGILLGLMLLGSIALIRDSLFGGSGKRVNSAVILLSSLAIMAGYITVIPFSWQRYSVPLIPFTSILASQGIIWGFKNSRRIFSHGSLSARLSQILAQFSADSRVP